MYVDYVQHVSCSRPCLVACACFVLPAQSALVVYSRQSGTVVCVALPRASFARALGL